MSPSHYKSTLDVQTASGLSVYRQKLYRIITLIASVLFV